MRNTTAIYFVDYVASMDTVPYLFQMLRLHNTAMGMDTSAAMADLWKEGKVRSDWKNIATINNHDS